MKIAEPLYVINIFEEKETSTIPDQGMQEEIRSIQLRSPGFPLVSKVTLTS